MELRHGTTLNKIKMKTTIRIFLTAITVLASYLFFYWIPFSFLMGLIKSELVPGILSIIPAAWVGYYVWKKSGAISVGLPTYIIMGGIILGTIGFLGGFLGPIIFTPKADQGPLLGIFITGPIGFIAGLMGGGLLWAIKGKNNPE